MARPRAKKASNPFDSDSDEEFVSKPRRIGAASPSENRSIQELESYAVNKAEKTTEKVNDCLKLAENIKDDAARTLVTLHEQGQQINRSHQTAVEIDRDLSKGETLLGSLGGWFSKPWKPKKTRQIKGPVLAEDNSYAKAEKRKDQREKLGLFQGDPKTRQYVEPTSAMEKVEVEKKKQEDTLSDLSDVLGQLKGMAADMGTEINSLKNNKTSMDMRISLTWERYTKRMSADDAAEWGDFRFRQRTALRLPGEWFRMGNWPSSN
ncbi:SNAP25 likeous protein SNAP33 [Apostasia shenzhenica]|uniref:SNAP25 likeous protein SNAP33 n=1 Tax=Apostasia shenzhenica TaxID=1088818 RepID=A0A2I0A462_9ASPA|nr:SNAP25 likeous protein SNAP33 [Apostasia shenzhenica]